MKKNVPVRAAVAAAACAALLAGCGNLRTERMSGPPQIAPPGAASLFSTSDREFATQLAAGSLFELEAARLATQRAQHPEVRRYAQQLLEDHSRAHQKLAEIFRLKNFAAPAAPPAHKQAELVQLQALAGGSFDAAFIRQVGLRQHQSDIGLAEGVARQATDPSLRAWAVEALPALRRHHQAAQVIAGQLAG